MWEFFIHMTSISKQSISRQSISKEKNEHGACTEGHGVNICIIK